MLRKTRRALTFESLEGKLLMSHGHAAPVAAAVHFSAVASFSLTGILNGLPLPNNNSTSGQVTQFSVTGTAGSMGKVKGTFSLYDPFYYGQRPNLSDATLTLTNKKGAIAVLIAPSPTTTYDYVITGGNRNYAAATGSGVLRVHFSQKLFGLVQVVLHTRAH